MCGVKTCQSLTVACNITGTNAAHRVRPCTRPRRDLAALDAPAGGQRFGASAFTMQRGFVGAPMEEPPVRPGTLNHASGMWPGHILQPPPVRLSAWLRTSTCPACVVVLIFSRFSLSSFLYVQYYIRLQWYVSQPSRLCPYCLPCWSPWQSRYMGARLRRPPYPGI